MTTNLELLVNMASCCGVCHADRRCMWKLCDISSHNKPDEGHSRRAADRLHQPALYSASSIVTIESKACGDNGISRLPMTSIISGIWFLFEIRAEEYHEEYDIRAQGYAHRGEHVGNVGLDAMIDDIFGLCIKSLISCRWRQWWTSWRHSSHLYLVDRPALLFVFSKQHILNRRRVPNLYYGVGDYSCSGGG